MTAEGNRLAAKVSLVMPTYNRAGYIESALASLLGQSRAIDEIVVVDDGSTDETPAVLARYGERIRYLRKENGGRASAMNHGIERSTGEFVWLFDDDDVAKPDALERMLGALERDPAAEFAYSGQIIGRERPDGTLFEERVVRVPEIAPEAMFQFVLKNYPFLTQGMLISRKCFDEVGLFDASYLRGQDYEFYIRLLRRFRGVKVDGPTFIWRVHDGPRGPGHAQHAGTQRGRVWMKYSAEMARAYRRDLPLGEYLVPRRGNEALSPVQRREALFHRMDAMASKALFDEMFADLEEALSVQLPIVERPLSKEEAHACANCGGYEYFLIGFEEDHQRVTARLLEITKCDSVGRQALAFLARGLIRSARYGDLPPRGRLRHLVCAARMLVSARRVPSSWPPRRNLVYQKAQAS
jgi:glycosyltransferase involved in cell wall biosynthesis